MYDFQESHDTTAKLEDVAGVGTVAIGMSQDIKFHLENVEPMKSFDVVWTVGHLLHTRMTHKVERTATGTKITHAYHTGGVMAPFNFLQAAAARERVKPAMAAIAKLAEAGAR